MNPESSRRESRADGTGRGGLTHDQRILLLALATGVPGVALGLVLLWAGDFGAKLQWTLTLVVVLAWLGLAFSLRDRVRRPLQTLSNLLAALREGDFSVRAREPRGDDPLGLAMWEINALEEILREQRLGAVEATALLGKVMEEIDLAVFAFDPDEELVLVNRAGERLLAQPSERIVGRSAESLGLEECLAGEAPRTLDATFPGGVGRWEVRRSTFRQGGIRHSLLVLSDLSRALREEERQAWKRLIRVLGHEINNSLAPIKSIAGSMRSLLARDDEASELEDDLREGLDVITGRAESLTRFMNSYARLARLPAPEREPLSVERWVRRIAELEIRHEVEVEPGPDVTIDADGDQLDQLLINLVRNAVEAAEETDGDVRVTWELREAAVEVRVVDEGPGLSSTSNLFVPFFSTKPGGTGIGLVLSRQIAEAHGGTLVLENRISAPGCRAVLTLPLDDAPGNPAAAPA